LSESLKGKHHSGGPNADRRIKSILDGCGSRGGQDVDFGLLGCNSLWICRKIPVFRENILSPSSGEKQLKKYHVKMLTGYGSFKALSSEGLLSRM
jgi:hypothetical protein